MEVILTKAAVAEQVSVDAAIASVSYQNWRVFLH